MRFITCLSDFMVPFLLLYIVGSGLFSRRNIYQDFLDGAKEGLTAVVTICPTLIGLMTAVGILRASGFLDFLCGILEKVTVHLGISGEIIPLTVVRMFSSSAATSLLLDIFKEYGTESQVGFMAAVLLSSTESVFYCMSVYFGITKVKKTRFTLPGAVAATLAGVAAAIWIGNMIG